MIEQDRAGLGRRIKTSSKFSPDDDGGVGEAPDDIAGLFEDEESRLHLLHIDELRDKYPDCIAGAASCLWVACSTSSPGRAFREIDEMHTERCDAVGEIELVRPVNTTPYPLIKYQAGLARRIEGRIREVGIVPVAELRNIEGTQFLDDWEFRDWNYPTRQRVAICFRDREGRKIRIHDPPQPASPPPIGVRSVGSLLAQNELSAVEDRESVRFQRKRRSPITAKNRSNEPMRGPFSRAERDRVHDRDVAVRRLLASAEFHVPPFHRTGKGGFLAYVPRLAGGAAVGGWEGGVTSRPHIKFCRDRTLLVNGGLPKPSVVEVRQQDKFKGDTRWGEVEKGTICRRAREYSQERKKEEEVGIIHPSSSLHDTSLFMMDTSLFMMNPAVH
ncbi:hypothetical protein BDK51DRAFT_32788 [Blyttiomyces helicus]|uniref:Uncharacterized protein n=1 Tax=Blyttiomyces helicus TaxID=388810 RepID=A0A4P9VYC6_9FUNG|nr:hypothetical protein BDK51DRAFT_32788 [Blyttiomyces helicus]|eukprot:RKO84781.1 hypothetical protein BDK51DRAFT_32788 [Blyttiomyces helicus]